MFFGIFVLQSSAIMSVVLISVYIKIPFDELVSKYSKKEIFIFSDSNLAKCK